MAGLIKVSEEQAWTAASWVFDHVLRQSIPSIPPTYERLSSELSDLLFEDRLDFLDLREASEDEKRAFLAALHEGFARTQREGCQSFGDPAFYPGFIARFKELINLVSANVNV